MTQPTDTFDWNQARAFLAAVEEGSFSAAARRLGLTQPTLGRQVAALEAKLGITLFERVGRGLVPTQAGLELLDHVRAMRDAAQHVSLTASGQSQAIEGEVRITASDLYSAYLLPSILMDLRRRAPRLEIDIVAANDIRDLQRREADIAIRHVRPEQPNLIARRVAETEAHFYASPDYLAQKGHPQTTEDLAHHDLIAFGDPDQMIGYLANIGIHLERENFRMRSDNGVVAWQCVRQGFGIAPMSDDVARLFPDVERILTDIEPIRFPVWLTTHRELHTSRRIRLVFDHLAEGFAQVVP